MKTIGIAALGLALASGAFAQYNKRAENQQDRIAQGVGSGQLTARETAHIERQEAALNRRVNVERTANGGHLTPAERRAVNQRQNTLSREIYRDKHNARAQR